MRYRPSFEEFAGLVRSASLVPVYRQLTGDTLTPVSAFCKIQEGDWAFLFESVVGGERIGRYSFLGTGPFRKFEARGTVTRTQEGDGPWVEATAADLRRLASRSAARQVRRRKASGRPVRPSRRSSA